MTDDKKCPLKREIWLVDYTYSYQPKKGLESFETETPLKKLRPSIVVSNNEQNIYTSDIIVCPITTKEVFNLKSFEMLLKTSNLNNLTAGSKVLFNLIFTLNRDFRLKKKIGQLDHEETKKMKDKIKLVLDI